MAFRVIDDKLKTKIIFALECGGEIRALAREFGLSHHTVRRWKKDIGKEPEPVKYGSFDRDRFRKDVKDLLVDELWDTNATGITNLADLITDLAAASLRRNRR